MGLGVEEVLKGICCLHTINLEKSSHGKIIIDHSMAEGTIKNVT